MRFYGLKAGTLKSLSQQNKPSYHSLGKLNLHIPFEDLLSLSGYTQFHISGEHLKLLHQLKYHHRDPFDRLLIAQALFENFTMISADKQFDLYGINRIW